jgi:hypothetical protein
MLVATIHVKQKLKRFIKKKKASLLPLFKKSLEKSFQIVRLKLANRL